MTNRSNNLILVGAGCVAASTHQGGGSHIFMDSHAKWLKGNSERYELQDDSGCWFERYDTKDR